MRTFSGGSVEKTSSFKNFTLKLTVKVRIPFLLFFLFNFYLLLLLQENKKRPKLQIAARPGHKVLLKSVHY